MADNTLSGFGTMPRQTKMRGFGVKGAGRMRRARPARSKIRQPRRVRAARKAGGGMRGLGGMNFRSGIRSTTRA